MPNPGERNLELALERLGWSDHHAAALACLIPDPDAREESVLALARMLPWPDSLRFGPVCAGVALQTAQDLRARHPDATPEVCDCAAHGLLLMALIFDPTTLPMPSTRD